MFDACRNLTYSLTHQIGEAIVRGNYAVDKSFPTEAELSVEFNISRNVTREAIKMLTAKGLLASRPRKGIRVMPSDYWNMFDPDVLNWTLSARPALQLLREFTQLRLAIEPEAARLAAANCGETEKMHAIANALEMMRRAKPGVSELLSADTAFHTAILAASNNPYFLQLRQFLQVALRASIANSGQLTSGFVLNYDEHKKIVDAILAGNGALAAESVRALLNEVMRLIDAAQAVSGARS